MKTVKNRFWITGNTKTKKYNQTKPTVKKHVKNQFFDIFIERILDISYNVNDK